MDGLVWGAYVGRECRDVWHCARFPKAEKSVMSMTVSMGSFIVSHPFRPEHYPVVYFITPENEVLTHILPACATEQEAGDAAHAAFDLIRKHEDWGPHNMPPRADLDDETHAQITRCVLAKIKAGDTRIMH